MITLEYDALNGMALPEGMVKPFVTETSFEIDTEDDFELLNARLITNQEPRKNLFGEK